MTKKTTKETGIAVLQTKVDTIITQANELTITDSTSLAYSSELLTNMKAYLKNLVDDKKFISAPYEAKLDEIAVVYDPIIKPLKAAIEIIRTSQGTYQTQLMREKAEADAKLAAKVASGYMKPETAAERITEVSTRVETDSGSTAFRPHPTLKVTDVSLIPDIYFNLDEARLLCDLKSGIKVNGAEILIVQIPINRKAK